MLKKLSLIVLLAVFIVSCESEKKDQESGTGADPMPFIVKNGYFYKNGKPPEKMFIAGINLGIGVPGTMAGELAASKEDYLRWFSLMSEAGFNSLRIYTIHFPQFYEALNEFNTANKDKPLYLFHGIWLDEEGMENGDLFTITDHFDEGIKEAVDVVHGNAEIGHRYGRAYGTYTVDISDWIAGWIIGREVSPFEVASTNFNNENIKSFEGKHFKIENCDPAEAWFTERLDVLAEYESEKYEVKRPLSMSSWPTLDPLKHRTEGSLSFEDTNKIDLSGIDDSNYIPGYFASYHAYPYYPNFMNTEPDYLSFSDNYGMNNYTGYLSDLKEHYKDSPLLIAEFGVPSSIGNAHFSVSGMHHGGHDETAQGNYIKRMFETIRDTGCAGGMYFAWIDEWWKRTWITDELDFPPERRPLWHNITAPEQNFGLIAFEPESGPVFKKTGEGSSAVTKVEMAADVKFFYLKLTSAGNASDIKDLEIGIDTYGDDTGESVLPGGTEPGVRSEFAITFSENKAVLMVTQAYDLYGIWHGTSSDSQLYHSTASDGGLWMPVRWLNSGEHGSDDGRYLFPDTGFFIGDLRTFTGNTAESTDHDLVIFDGNSLLIRVPWTLIQFTDPSSLLVMDDDRETPERETALSDGIRAAVTFKDGEVITERFLWEPWDTVPEMAEREKMSYHIVKEFFDSFSTEPVTKENIVAESAFEKLEWGENEAAFSTGADEDGCIPVTVTVSEHTDGEAGWYFEPVKLSKGWYEYSDMSRSDTVSEVILSCGLEKFMSIGQSVSAPSFERNSARFFVPEECSYTVLRSLSRNGTLEVCGHSLSKTEPVRLENPVITFSFDDIWASAATEGAAELEKRGWRGTFFVSKKFAAGEDPQYAGENMITELDSRGHEIGFHGSKHTMFTGMTVEEAEADIAEGLAWLGGLGIQPEGMAFPFGDLDESSVSAVRKHFSYSRTSFNGLNDLAMNRYGIRVFPVTASTTLQELKDFTQSVIDESVWGVFLFHDIGEPDGINEYLTSLDDFKELLDMAGGSGVTVETAGNMMKKLDLPPM